MMMVTDATKCEKSAAQNARNQLEAVGKEIGVSILCQHEDIFNMMHRI